MKVRQSQQEMKKRRRVKWMLMLGGVIAAFYFFTQSNIIDMIFEKSGIDKQVKTLGVTLAYSMLDESETTQRWLETKGISEELRASAAQAQSLLDTRPRIISTVGDEIAIRNNLSYHDTNLRLLCESKTPQSVVSCFAATKSSNNADRLYRYLNSGYLHPCSAGNNKGTAWLFAMGYDQLKAVGYSADYQQIESRIEEGLEQCLDVLDGYSASMWHGRFSIGAEAYITAAALYQSGPLLDRAFKHFWQSILALTITEGWPESYNYWIQNRAIPFYLAVNTYLTVGKNEELKAHLRHLALRNGLWHIYMTRPDFQIQASGDEGSKSDLKDESKKAIDLIARITRNPVFATYAQLLHQQHRNRGYHASYRWLIPFTYDPSVIPRDNPTGSLAVFDGWLPNDQIFGEGFLNQIVIREGWGAQDAFLMVTAGQQFTHHQHADAGHFVLFDDGKPLITDGASYASIKSPSRLYYGVRSTSKNLPNLANSDADYKPNKLFVRDVRDGTQRLIMPTGSAVTSVDNWLINLGRGADFDRARLVRYEHTAVGYELTLDLTAAYYHSGNREDKRVLREIIFNPGQSLLVQDELVNIDSEFLYHWNLQTGTQGLVCTPGDQVQTFVLVNGSQVEMSGSSNRGCDSDLARQFKKEVGDALADIEETSKKKPWYDGVPMIVYWSGQAGTHTTIRGLNYRTPQQSTMEHAK
ncbi:heparinase II/III family protein [Bowmanella sp. JS7-9]|uniref:Heparinase II/III family protein n=2 Tax=Pseudobowmanella zhangzhouensis TaxID=1537679 RepID=A0ABW1XF43_9ALTE|nr:heparinase II/III family protein [Bowmanella sp. JS7-9]